MTSPQHHSATTDAAQCLTSLESYTRGARIAFEVSQPEEQAKILRFYTDRIRNAAQALEGCAAALEGK